jgi:CRP-like cAMP-binding protein
MAKQDTVLRAHAPWCRNCPLRALPAFADFDEAELRFMERFKVEHRLVLTGAELILEGTKQPQFATLFSGWALRYRKLADGRRHNLAVLLPGDLIGLDSVVCDASQVSVQAVTDLTYCAFDVRGTAGLRAVEARIAHRILSRAVDDLRRQERRSVTAAVGSARERLAAFFIDLHSRLLRLRLADEASFSFPLTQQHVADHLGINVVHVNRIMRGLREAGMLHMEDHTIVIDDRPAIELAARIHIDTVAAVPLI